MKPTAPRKAKQEEKDGWPRKVPFGREIVPVYRRKTPLGNFAYMVANYSGEKRRFDSYADESLALEAALKLAKQMSKREVLAAAMTNEQASEYAAAVQSLDPFNLSLISAADAVANALKTIGGFESMEKVKEAAAQEKLLPELAELQAAAKFYRERHKKIKPMRVAAVVAELLELKESRGGAERYVSDLKFRLEKFAGKFQRNIGSVTTPNLQAWLDGLKLSSQSYANNRRVAHLLFEFAVARGYCLDNPALKVERPKIRNGEVKVFTPDEARRLLAVVSEDFRPCLAIGLFAGLRSAEIERLEWKYIDMKQGHIVLGADIAKTASRRIVPIVENLAAWLALAPEEKRKGAVWPHGRDWFHKCQLVAAKATEVRADADNGIAAQKPVKWKANGCRHSFASYSFALSNDAGRVAGYCGNSAKVIHRHYRQLVTPEDAVKFFSIKPPQSVVASSVSTPTLEAKTIN
jgi:integrase